MIDEPNRQYKRDIGSRRYFSMSNRNLLIIKKEISVFLIEINVASYFKFVISEVSYTVYNGGIFIKRPGLLNVLCDIIPI